MRCHLRAYGSGRRSQHDADVTHDDLRPDERELFASLVRAHGRDPGSFSITLQPDGLVRLSGPRGTAFYPRESWPTRFARHLEKSFFDPTSRPTPRSVRQQDATPAKG